MTSKVIDATHISKRFKDNIVLNDIDFSVNKGDIVALLGNNGAGKSTLINILTQIIPKDEGSITYFDQDENKLINREKISMMTQETVIIKNIHVGELIHLTRSFSSHPLDYDILMDYADLKEQENDLVEKLSGGQRRRLGFAMSLANDPEVIFLDEPTAGLDSYSRVKFWKVITDLKNKGKTFVVTSHYLEELEKVVDRIVILVNGSFAFDGTMGQLRNSYGKSDIQFYSSKHENYWKEVPGVYSVRKVNQKTFIISHDVPMFLESIKGNYKELTQLSIQPNSLESLFDRIQEESQL